MSEASLSIELRLKLQKSQITDEEDLEETMATHHPSSDSLSAMERAIEWKDQTKRDAYEALCVEVEKLVKSAHPGETERWQKEMQGFKDIFVRFLHVKPTITWGKIEPLPEGAIKDYAALPRADTQRVKDYLSKIVVVKLNGGLGTSMGCKGPKSVIPVRHDLTFLDLTLQQIEALNAAYGVNVPLVLMNSFNTDEDTAKVLKKYKGVKVVVECFNQSRYPRINKETYMPVATDLYSEHHAWYPPGHGNFYEAFVNSGLVDNFLNQGKEYCFVSNIDNLGATIDLNIVQFLFQPDSAGVRPGFVMEVTDKTRADVKGGTLIHYEGKLMLLEVAQVPKDKQDEFKNVSKFKIFNTNNLWANLGEIKSLVESRRLEMEIIVNPKYSGELGLEVVQLETAAGAAIKNFKGAVGINVPRSRFLPVKKTSDLLLVMSNLYEMESGELVFNPKRSFPTTPLVKLGSSFDKVQEFLKRFPGIPDILELDHLTVSGDVWFGKGVSLKGTVIIIANHGDRIDIPTNACLENKIVSGNLRILDH